MTDAERAREIVDQFPVPEEFDAKECLIEEIAEAFNVVRREALTARTLEHNVSKMVVAITREDLIFRLRQHVRSRGKPSVPNGAWALMLEAANQLEADYIERHTKGDGE